MIETKIEEIKDDEEEEIIYLYQHLMQINISYYLNYNYYITYYHLPFYFTITFY